MITNILLILIGFTIHGRSIRRIELDNALKSSMESAMTSLMYEEGCPKNEEEWLGGDEAKALYDKAPEHDVMITSEKARRARQYRPSLRESSVRSSPSRFCGTTKTPFTLINISITSPISELSRKFSASEFRTASKTVCFSLES